MAEEVAFQFAGKATTYRWMKPAHLHPVQADISTSASRAIRLTELDGIRGWAAFVVVLYHLGWETFGDVVPAFHTPWVAALNGRIAVGLFFILSGEALSAGFLVSGNLRGLASLAVRRPLRLSIPVFGSVLLVLLLQRLNLTFQHDAYTLVRNSGDFWLGSDPLDRLTLYSVAKFSFLSMYAGEPGGSYNPFTWTMPYEMAGSVLVFAILPMIGLLRRPKACIAIFAFACLFAGVTAGYMGCFMLGVVCAMLRLEGTFERLASKKAVIVCSAIGIVLACVLSSFTLTHNKQRTDLLVAILLAFSIYTNAAAMAFFRSKVSQALGRISFALYLVQFPVIISFTSYAILYSNYNINTSLQEASVIVLLSTVVIIIVAIAFEPIEILTRWIGQRLVRSILKV